jgi:hypothetical protein
MASLTIEPASQRRWMAPWSRSLPLRRAARPTDPEALAPRITGYRLLPAARADLLARAGRLDEAAEHYRAALALASAPAERAALARRLGDTSVAGPVGRA